MQIEKICKGHLWSYTVINQIGNSVPEKKGGVQGGKLRSSERLNLEVTWGLNIELQSCDYLSFISMHH